MDEEAAVTNTGGSATDSDAVAESDSTSDPKRSEKNEDHMPPTGKFLQRFYVDPILTTKSLGSFSIKPIGMLVFVGLIAYAAQAYYFAFELTPPNKQEEWFPGDHMWTGFLDDLQDNYIAQTDEQYMAGRLAFGIAGIDRAGYDFWRPGRNLGTPIFDPDFNVTSAEAQQALLNACSLLRNRECDSEGCDVPVLAFPHTIQCFIEDFRDWMDATHSITIPADFSEPDFLSYVEEFRAEYPSYESDVGVIDGQLRYIVVDFLFTLVIGGGHDVTGDVIDLKNQLAAEIAANTTGTGVGHVMIAGDEWMVFYDTQSGLISNLVQGLGISTPVVFFLLLIATKNLQIAGVAVFTVLSIVASVLGLCKWNGWDLGVAEAIAGVIVIGFAVDYTLHLGHMYMEAAHHGYESREDRFRFAIGTMGSTVVAGAVTTFGSGCFMFLAQLTFFYKMAVLMCSTIAFSFLFSFGFFMAHCAVIGPEGNFAILPFDKWFCRLRAFLVSCWPCR